MDESQGFMGAFGGSVPCSRVQIHVINLIIQKIKIELLQSVTKTNVTKSGRLRRRSHSVADNKAQTTENV